MNIYGDLTQFQDASDNAQELKDIKPALVKKTIPGGDYCKNDKVICRFLVELGKACYCGLSFDGSSGKSIKIENYEKVCQEPGLHIGFKENYLYSE